jgi:microcystin-dependent protein
MATPSPITAVDFQPVNFEGDICAQLRSLLQTNDKLNLFFSWMLNADGTISNTFKQQFTSLFLPVGSIIWMPVNLVPDGYLVANGQEVSKTTYANLFSIYATNFGVASNPTDNFKLPDMQGRFPIGQGGSYPFYTPGGEATHILTIGEMPSHTHTASPSFRTLQGFDPTLAGARDLGAGNDTGDMTIDNTGGGLAHNNVPPYLAGYWLVKF